MTKNEQILAKYLDLCVFVPGTATKRFAKDMAWRAQQPQPKPLTEKQSEYLRTAVIRFRRHIPADVVELARSLELAHG